MTEPTAKPAKSPKPTAPALTPLQSLEAAVEALVSASRPLADANQLDVGNYRLQFAGGELLSLSHK
jgi:hypothetical protein